MTPSHTAHYSSWNSLRWKGITRPYTHADVDRLRGSVQIEYTLARNGAEKFWKLLKNERFVPALGALNGDQAVEMAQAGLQAICLGECPITSEHSITSNRISDTVRAVNQALLRADQAAHSRGRRAPDMMLPIVAQGDTSNSGSSTFDVTKNLIESGAAAICIDDQLSSERKCGNETGKVLIPLEEMIQKLVAARLAADTMGVPTVIIARTDAESAGYVTSDHDERDHRFLTGERTNTGYHVYRGGLHAAINRALACAPYADLLWCETSDLNKEDARKFADAIHAKFPGKMLAYNCSPSHHWRGKMNEENIACFQRDLATMGYRFQFISLAGYHTLNLSMFQFAKDYAREGMTAFSQLQQLEREMAERLGHARIKPRRTVEPRHSEAVGAAIGRVPQVTRGRERQTHPDDETLDYNDGEATERMPMPHLYPSLEPPQRPMAAAAD